MKKGDETIVKALEFKFELLKTEIADLLSNKTNNECTNTRRRFYYASIGLLKIDIEDNKDEFTHSLLFDGYLNELNIMADRMNLSFITPHGNILITIAEKIDELVRLLGVLSCIVVSAAFFAIPSIIIKQLDYFLLSKGLRTPYNQISVLTKRIIAYSVLVLSGISLDVEGTR